MGRSLYIVLQDLALGSELGRPPPEEYHLGLGERENGRSGRWDGWIPESISGEGCVWP